MESYSFTGSHFDAGLQLGGQVKKAALKRAMRLTAHQKKLASDSMRIVEQQLPQFLQEIEGMAAATAIPFETIFAWLLTMYNRGTRGCTCVAYHDGRRHYFGRNSDFLPFMEKKASTSDYRLVNSYRFQGQSTAIIQMEDGINEHGLAAGMNFIQGYRPEPGINAGMQIRWILENCRTVSEALSFLMDSPSMSTHNLMLADAEGRAVVVECSPRKKAVRERTGRFIIATNHFQTDLMKAEDRCPKPDWYETRSRMTRLTESLSESCELSQRELQKRLKNPQIVCNYRKFLNFSTIWSVTAELNQPSVSLAKGNPVKTPYAERIF